MYKIADYFHQDCGYFDVKLFVEICTQLLYDGNINALESEIRDNIIKLNIIENLPDIHTEIEYLLKNAKRIQYPRFESANLPIESGIIEATCKQLVQLRLKRNGMRWKKKRELITFLH